MQSDAKTVSLSRHKAQCSICAHEKCAEMETAFMNWESPASITKQYGLADRTTVYRHAHALGLFEKRKRNVRAALERIIEKSGEVEVTASAVVSAIQAYAKINAQGQWVERSEHINLTELFERMQRRTGTLRQRRQSAGLVHGNRAGPARNRKGRWGGSVSGRKSGKRQKSADLTRNKFRSQTGRFSS